MTPSAIISPCGTYRYTLHRNIATMLRWVRPCLFMMLNPSTADATQDDPTIRRCRGFAEARGCSDLTVVNLFALRATNPAELAKHPDPIGPENAKHVAEQIANHQDIGIIIAAWGAHPITSHYMQTSALKMTLRNAGALCLGTTKDGSPRHPLYVSSKQPLERWNPS